MRRVTKWDVLLNEMCYCSWPYDNIFWTISNTNGHCDTNQLLDIIIQNQPLWYKEEDEEGKICQS